MSFSHTERQILDRSKTVTRRTGWRNLAPGQLLRAVHKTMGLKAGESPRELAIIRVVDVRQERVDLITAEDCRREGFPEYSPADFVLFFCREFGAAPSDVLTRIEFEYTTDPELVSQADDRRAPGVGLPRHHSSRSRPRNAVPRPSTLWDAQPAFHEPEPLFGVYPRGFLKWLLPMLGSPAHRDLLHVCSGTLDQKAIGYRVDIRDAACPDVVADGRRLPFQNSVVRAVLVDPPWTVEYARMLYGTEYPRPSHLLREAARVVKPGGRIGFVHFLVPNPPPGCKLVSVHGVTQGCGYRIRALTIYERGAVGMFD